MGMAWRGVSRTYVARYSLPPSHRNHGQKLKPEPDEQGGLPSFRWSLNLAENVLDIGNGRLRVMSLSDLRLCSPRRRGRS